MSDYPPQQPYGQQPYGQQPYGQQPYGQQYPSYPQGGGYPAPAVQQGNGLAIAGMVCGIVGLLIFWIVLSPLAIIFGGIGLSRANRGAKYRGQAIAGIVLGIIGIIGYVVLLAVIANHHFVI